MIYFKSIKWKNLLSSGNVYTEIFLDKSPTTLVLGENGAGKSTLLDALCFVLFGKPFRKINKPQLLNSVNQKDLKVEVELTINSVDYRIIRGMKPNIFEIYVNDQLLNQTAANKDYQEYLEKNILKLNYNSFTQIVILGSSTFIPFMQLPAAARREIIEDLLDLKIFTVMNYILKDKLQFKNGAIRTAKSDLELTKEKLKIHYKHVDDLREDNKKRIKRLKEYIEETNTSIEVKNNEIMELTTEIESLLKISSDQRKLESKQEKLKSYFRTFNEKSITLKKDLEFYNENDICPTCDQKIDGDFKKHEMEKCSSKLEELNSANIKLVEELDKVAGELETIYDTNRKINDKNKEIAILNNTIYSLKENIKKADSEIDAETNKVSNIREENKLIKKLIKEGESLEQDIEVLFKEKNIMETAADLLKDRGIKAQIVKQYIPIMNKLINKYLTSMDFFVSFELNEKFEETIKSRFRMISAMLHLVKVKKCGLIWHFF